MTDAEFLHQKETSPTKPNLGKVWVLENAMTRIGGLALIRRRLSHHERAAEWFKNAYEALYGAGFSPAIDMEKVRVDTSILFHDTSMVARLDRGDKLREVMEALGEAPRDRVIACVVLGSPCADFAVPGPSGRPSGHAVEREVDHLLAALDRVAELCGFKTVAA